MKRRFLLSMIYTTTIFIGVAIGFIKLNPANNRAVVEAAPRKVSQGALQAIDSNGQPRAECPLRRTDVKAEISGSLARVTVTQDFHNPFEEKIEAVYAFPLPQSAAVDDMTMIVGDRAVKGKIKRREEARAIYEAARDAGQTASLLDQERPNIFTQSVTNIAPGAEVKITISYVEFLKYEDGTYEFVFPMVVGPRYIPGQPFSEQALPTGGPNDGSNGAPSGAPSGAPGGAPGGGGWAPDTSQVPDASRITPHVAPEGIRAGHDISIEVKLDTGVPIDDLKSTLHEVDVTRHDDRRAVVRLKNQSTIPNKDFILKFDVAGKKIADAVMTHRGAQGGFFTLMLQPPERVTAADVTPKELVFVLDTSGSMQGFPIEKAKETMKLALDNLYPDDTFNLITFAGDTRILFPRPVQATRENLHRAQVFLASHQGSGGTEMMKAIRAALATSDKNDHVRIVCFMTDGYVGNDMEIISEVQKHPNARVFSFGIGSSVNRFLLDKMAEAGRGEVEYVSLEDDGSAAARRFHERVRNPLLTDIEIDWSGLPVKDVYPKRIPDLFSVKPLILTGRYTGAARGVIRLRGNLAGQNFIREIPVELPESQNEHDVLSTLWARTRIDDLMSQDYAGLQNGSTKPELQEAITQLGLEYRLMTQFTSFVAVEEMTLTDGGKPRRIDVQVELPEGVSHDGVFGADAPAPRRSRIAGFYSGREASQSVAGSAGKTAATPPPPNASAVNGPAAAADKLESIARNQSPTSFDDRKSISVSGGVLNTSATRKVQPTYPATARTAKMSGSVQVQITIDERGEVINAQVINGHPLLRDATLEAAKKWRFKPTELSGKPIKTQGVLSFNFDSNKGWAPGETASLIPLTEERIKQQLLAKLHPAIASVIERLRNKNANPGAEELKFTRDGKAEIQVWLSDKTAASIEELKKLGFDVILDPQSSKAIIGRLPIDKLAALAELPVVRYIAPQMK